MTEIFTSSYKAFQPHWGTPIVTSRGLPRWRPEAQHWTRYWLLTPTSREFELTGDEFRDAYLGRLERYGIGSIAASLEALAKALESSRWRSCVSRNRPHGAIEAT